MASSSSLQPRKYEVFLSFRGEDTRNSFVSHLLTALQQRGIRTFFDGNNLEKGQSISPTLSKSIEESKFAIIVLSKTYASSTWCLDELVKIMECRSKYGQTVIPVFYDVDPSVVRKQKESFGDEFAKHEVNFKNNLEKVQIWKENLREVANIAGHDLSTRKVTEAACIKEIVEEIFSKLPRKASPKGLVGIEYRMKKLSSLLHKKPNDVCFVGIWGMGGIGKTTIARAILDELLIGGFEGSCFLQDVCKRDITVLQKTLILEVLKLDVNISDEYQGSNIIRDRFCFKRVLLVLDDVNDKKQLKVLAGEREWFGAGSRIIITTRDKHLLTEVDDTYEAELLFPTEATELFSWHAFKMSHPPENFVQLSNRVVSYASMLPLALEVLGSHLRDKGISVWESVLAILKDGAKDGPEEKVFAVLKISFEGLSNIQKDIFLDIACFFRGDPEDTVKNKLHSFGFHPEDGIVVLIQKSLIHISDGNIEMHDLIREMGLNIVRREANEELGKYSRLWNLNDIRNVLKNNTATDQIKGLVVKTVGMLIAEWPPSMYSRGAFRKMSKLRLLNVNGRNIRMAPDYLPNTLQWFHWSSFPGKSLPENFKPKHLISLDLSFSKILQTPNVSDMPNLKVLNLLGCEMLSEVHPSVVVHKKLVHLNLAMCFKLNAFPKLIQMKSLENLNLSECSLLKVFAEIHSNMSSLRILDLRGTKKIQELPWSFGDLTSLREINMNGCRSLRALPRSLCRLKDLESVTLIGCSKLEYILENPHGEGVQLFDSQPSSLERNRAECNGPSNILAVFLSLPSLRKLNMAYCNVSNLIFPESIGCLASLQELDLSYNSFVSLPESINSLCCLQLLCLRDCKKLEELPELPSEYKGAYSR